MKKSRHVPDKFHPGEILVEELKTRGMNMPEFILRCVNLGLYGIYVGEVLRQNAPITRPIAVALEEILGSSAEMWMNLQKEYDR